MRCLLRMRAPSLPSWVKQEERLRRRLPGVPGGMQAGPRFLWQVVVFSGPPVRLLWHGGVPVLGPGAGREQVWLMGLAPDSGRGGGRQRWGTHFTYVDVLPQCCGGDGLIPGGDAQRAP